MERNNKVRIEQYLDGLLSEEGKKAFEKDLQQNTDLSDAFEKYLRENKVLSEGETSKSIDLIEEAKSENYEIEQNIQPSENIDLEINKEVTGKNEKTIEESKDDYIEGVDLSTYLRPIAIFLLGLSLYFFIKNGCNEKQQVPEIFAQQSEASPHVEEEFSNENESILEDIAERPEDIRPEEGELTADTSASNSFAPPPPTKDEEADCSIRIREADRYYKIGNYEAAQMPLATIIQTENSACQADAWYYLGLIRLKLGDPQSALQCLAKVDNLEKYGLDVQWYMALAFYEMAQSEYEIRPRAKRAFEQQLDVQLSLERKAKAKEIIKELQ